MSNQPLTSYQHGTPAIKLYDSECVLDIESDKAQGFLVLLRQGSDSNLAFMSLTDGNIIEACVGAPPQSRQGPRYQIAKDAKDSLADASDTSDAIMDLAVQTYARAMDVSINYHMKLRRTLFCIRCCIAGSTRRKAKRDLDLVFKPLEEAVESSTQ